MRQLFSQAIASIAFNVKTLLSTLFSRKTGVAIAAVFLLFVSTACNPSSPDVVGSSGSSTEIKGQQTELYDGVQPNAGGMNQHNDDFRYDRGTTKGKADQLIRQADQNLGKAQSPKDAVENLQKTDLGKKARELSQDVKSNLDKVTTDVSEGAKRGTENLKANAKQAEKNVKGFGNDAADQAQRAIDKATDRT